MYYIENGGWVGEESILSEVSLWSQGKMFFIRQEDLAGFRKESKHPQKQRKHLPIFQFGCKGLLTAPQLFPQAPPY